MSMHPNVARIQQGWDGIAEGNLVTALEMVADDVVVENGPGAGPDRWRYLNDKVAYFTMGMEFGQFFGGTFQQKGTCVYADDKQAVSIVRETGTLANGDTFDNDAVYVFRFNDSGLIDRIWTVDLDDEHVRGFWKRNPAPN
jgi:ketosteroid isomerase-like protein